VLRAALALCLATLSMSACASTNGASTACADPPLATTSGNTVSGEFAIHLWKRDGRLETLTPGPVDGGPRRGAALSPDGATVAFALAEGEYSDSLGYPKTRVAVLSLETREVTALSSDIPNAKVSHLHWSADGSEIAFIRSSRGPTEIVAVDVEDAEERTLLRLDDRHNNAFAWSSDGRELLVPVPTRPDTPPGSGAPEYELWRYSLDTGDYEVIATPHPGIRDLAWSPDDRLVAMSANTPGTTDPRLYVLDLESGTSTPVDRRGGVPVGLTWSGPYLLYTEDALHLMRWDSRSKERARVNRPQLDEVLDQAGIISAPRCSL
jgi:dipeptidyl aminopeptidase/acylaminoacyl peptidase